MDTELQAYKDSIAKVGEAVANMNAARAALHSAVEAEADSIGKKVAEDTAAKTIPAS